MLICRAPSKRGMWCQYDLDDKSNPTFNPHKCPVAEAKKKARIILLPGTKIKT